MLCLGAAFLRSDSSRTASDAIIPGWLCITFTNELTIRRADLRRNCSSPTTAGFSPSGLLISTKYYADARNLSSTAFSRFGGVGPSFKAIIAGSTSASA